MYINPIFSVQRLIEDALERSGIQDDGRYSVAAANLYFRFGKQESDDELLRRFRRIQTVTFKNNPQISRLAFEKQLLRLLRRMVKLSGAMDLLSVPAAKSELRRLNRKPRRSIKSVLLAFQRATQGRTVDAFWISRVAQKLQKRPETIAQSMLTQFIMGVISDKKGGHVFREVVSGIGFVDLTVMFGATAHLVELKVQTKQFTGAAQLDTYMATEGRQEGWLIVFDARKATAKAQIPSVIRTQAGRINVIVVDINPIPPSRIK